MRKRTLFALFLLLALIGGVVSTFFLKSREMKLLPLTVGGGLSVNTALFQIALDKGFFRDEGLDLTFVVYNSAHLAFADMLEGKVDLALSAETPVVFKALEREDFSILASIFSSYNDPKLLCLKSSGIEVPADLVGKRLGTTQRGQSAHYFLHLFMTKYGIKDDEVELVFKSPSELSELVKGGELDCISLFEPFLSKTAEELGEAALVFSEPELYYKYVLLTGRDDYVEQNESLVERVIKGLLRAEEFAIASREEAIEIVAHRVAVEKTIVIELFKESNLEVVLDQTLLLTLEEQARWYLEVLNSSERSRELPAFWEMIERRPLERVKPDGVTIF